MPHEIGKTYWHVGNSGVEFKIIDEGFGPTFVVDSAAFGNLKNKQKFYTDIESLTALRDLLNKAIEYKDYSKVYCEPASVLKAKIIDSIVKESFAFGDVARKLKQNMKEWIKGLWVPSQYDLHLDKQNYDWWMSKNKGKFFVGAPEDKEVTQMREKEQRREVNEQQVQDWIKIFQGKL